MWIVVHKIGYYPSVFEFNSHDEAIVAYEKIKSEEYRHEDSLEDARTYIAKIENKHGNYNENVDWYIDL